MRTDANAIRGHELVTPYVDLEGVKEWAKKRTPEAAVVAATLVLLGYVGAVIYQGLNTFTMVGL